MTIGEKTNIPKIIKYGVLVLSLVFSYSLIGNIREIYNSAEEVETARQRLEQALAEREKFELELEYMSSDVYLERQARDRLGLAREGEVVVVLPDDEILRRMAPKVRVGEDNVLPDPVWKKWVNLFL